MSEQSESTYAIPAESIAVEHEVKRSRFIALVERIQDRQQALAAIEQIKIRYPDARHHCWAYVAGPPEGATSIAFNDDGEPQGTAGKPILNVVQHHKVGEVLVVVVRYFGGVKLGAGGLVRAYSGVTQAALEKLPTILKVPCITATVSCQYSFEPILKSLLPEYQGTIIDCQYTDHVEMAIQLPLENKQLMTAAITNKSKGQAKIT
ncbi:YigZ family protein [Endozoicomonas sp. SM1973]|uniref:YigZ family protein n=1 Tax=Spartinivicinus marinus TaxID=2994442 RepID=A0A853I459_9GAMM|nr:YigZ family protein [Spartinivicinus marinus]MCX4028457.1 YigZ family protein [Spartinivicinus marinus]NYZ67429.1 YigZ family protein [Spartinivicinus marinus]